MPAPGLEPNQSFILALTDAGGESDNHSSFTPTTLSSKLLRAECSRVSLADYDPV